ncbi:phage tail tape measure protein [Halocella sp. SP3-1]|uniref:phage tail tape measure protein n=1 Tax=Halocella sp. SP3-1 TaxID=2382161 RepID=UPI000F75CEB0|nr:phage tail tape measure protein [Halocella sp. SP3-1]AZO95284.1 phage tail tape measure protein [Halocella sp. SP3-1]
MGMKVGELYAELGLNDKKFNSGLSKAKSMLTKGLVGAAVTGAAGVTAAITGAAVKGVKEFASFEKGMNEVFTLLPNASEQAMSQMMDDVREFSVEMGAATNETVPALYQAISAGVPKDNVFDFLETAQQAAVGGVTDLTTAVDGISSVVNAYGSDVLSASEASDLMFTAVKKGKTTFEELSSSLYNVIPTASSLGVRFGDITAAIASMTAQGTPTAQATTQMRQALNELSTAGSDASDIFKEVAGKSFTEFIAQGGNMQEAMAIMSQAASESGVSVKDLFSSVEAGQAALALTGKGAKTFKENILEMADSAGSTQDAYEQMDKSLSRTFDKLKAAIHDVFLEIGEVLKPAMEKLTKWIQSNMPLIKEIAANVFEKIGDAIIWVVDVAIPKIIEGFNWLKEQIAEFAKSPEENFSDMKEKVIAIVVSMMAGILAAIVKGTAGWVGKMLKMSLEGWKLMAHDALEAIGNLAEEIAGIFAGLIESAYNWGKNIIQGLINGIKSMIKKAVKAVKNAVSSIVSAAKGALGINSPSKVFQGIGENVTTGLQKGIENTQSNLQMKVDAMVNGMIPQTAAAGAGGAQVINLTVSQHITDKSTAEYANNNLVSKLKSRGVGGSYR